MVRPTLTNHVTCEYGRPGDWAAGYHTGIDYRAAVGDEIFATKGGKVVYEGDRHPYGNAYGKVVILQTFFRFKRRQVLYAHLSSTNVSVGERVKAGDVIGYGGQTGNTFGAHLHYEERLSPFGYWDHYRPVLTTWQPKNKVWLNIVLRRIGVITTKQMRRRNLRIRNKR